MGSKRGTPTGLIHSLRTGTLVSETPAQVAAGLTAEHLEKASAFWKITGLGHPELCNNDVFEDMLFIARNLDPIRISTNIDYC
ncbi:unnamed protein product [Amoebophrya sp. A25]|nr:unnamed protein product [Amoebophrya sp. A25]|eukprot:GSA25T00005849001.1